MQRRAVIRAVVGVLHQQRTCTVSPTTNLHSFTNNEPAQFHQQRICTVSPTTNLHSFAPYNNEPAQFNLSNETKTSTHSFPLYKMPPKNTDIPLALKPNRPALDLDGCTPAFAQTQLFAPLLVFFTNNEPYDEPAQFRAIQQRTCTVQPK